VLAERTRVSVSLLHAEPATAAQLERQLRELRASAFGRWLRPSGPGQPAEIDLGRTVSERGVVLFRLGGSPSDSAALLTRLICRDLLAAGAALDRIGVASDGLVWLAECGSMPRSPVTDMIARGPGAGLPVLASTTSARAAAELAGLTNVVVVHRTDDAVAAGHLAAVAGSADPPVPPGAGPAADPGDSAGPSAGGDPGSAHAVSPGSLAALRDGEFLLAVKSPPRLVPRALAVRARVPQPAHGAQGARSTRDARTAVAGQRA
jgi:hypothetical protein